jgi:hypothetical protein
MIDVDLLGMSIPFGEENNIVQSQKSKMKISKSFRSKLLNSPVILIQYLASTKKK